MVTRMLLSVIFSMLLILHMKSVESWTYDLSSFTCGCNWLSIYFEIFVVWQSIQLPTVLPGFPLPQILGTILNCSVFASELFHSKGVMILVH